MISRFKHLTYANKAVVINSVILLIWWLAFNPGFYSIDSIGIIEMVRVGPLTSGSTAIWAIFVKFLTINGSHPEIATLFFSQILAFSVSIFASTFFKGKISMWSSGILCATPLVGGMGITLWHDIPMTSGFLLAAAGFHRFKQKEPHALFLLIFGIILSSFRYNGLPTLFLTLIVLLGLRQSRKLIAVTAAVIIIVGGITSVLNSRFSPPLETQSDGFINWMRYDLSCYAATSKDDMFFKKAFNNKSSLQDWSSELACTWFNNSTAFQQRSDSINQRIPSAWVALTKKDPLFVLTTHLHRNAYLNPIPLYGLPSMPFIHTTIEKPGVGIDFWHPSLTEKLRSYPRIWNYFNYIFGYSGFWLLVIFIFAWWKRSSFYLGVGLLGLVLNSGLFIFAIISDGRFSLFVLIAGQLLLLEEIITRSKALANRVGKLFNLRP